MERTSSRPVDPREALARMVQDAIRPTRAETVLPLVLLAVSGALVVFVDKMIVAAFAGVLTGLAIGMFLRRPSL